MELQELRPAEESSFKLIRITKKYLEKAIQFTEQRFSGFLNVFKTINIDKNYFY